jgi:hypothetical protein
VVDPQAGKARVFPSWVELEKYYANVWSKLTRGGIIRRGWTPDYTPVPPYNPQAQQIEEYLRGVR